jgi:hypothetical protein
VSTKISSVLLFINISKIGPTRRIKPPSMQTPPATDLGEVRIGEGSVAEMPLPEDISDALIQTGKFVLPALKKVIDAILLPIALEINYSSMHPYHLIKTDIRNQDNPLTEEDILAGGCCYPHMDCVGSAYFIRDKIIATFRKYREEGTVYIETFC